MVTGSTHHTQTQVRNKRSDIAIGSHLTLKNTSQLPIFDILLRQILMSYNETPIRRKRAVSLGKLVFDTESPTS